MSNSADLPKRARLAAESAFVVDLTSIAPNRGGGVERVAIGVIEGLLELGVRVRCLIPQATTETWAGVVPRDKRVALDEVQVALRAGSRWQSAARKILPARLKQGSVVGWVRRQRATAVMKAAPASPVWFPFHRSVAMAAKSIITVHDLRVFQEGMLSPMDQRVISENIRTADAVVCSWVHPYEQLIERFPEAASKTFRISLPVLNAGNSVARSIDPDGDVHLLYPAFIAPHKNHEVIVRSLVSLPRVRLICTGAESEPYASTLRQLARDLGVDDRISWRGYVTTEELEEAYSSAHILVMPSRWEAASGPIYEAIARNLPIVASNIAPIRAQLGALGIQNVTFDADDSDALAARIRETVVDYPAVLDSLAVPAETVRSRTWTETARDYLRVHDWVSTTGPKPTDLQGTPK